MKQTKADRVTVDGSQAWQRSITTYNHLNDEDIEDITNLVMADPNVRVIIETWDRRDLIVCNPL